MAFIRVIFATQRFEIFCLYDFLFNTRPLLEAFPFVFFFFGGWRKNTYHCSLCHSNKLGLLIAVLSWELEVSCFFSYRQQCQQRDTRSIPTSIINIKSSPSGTYIKNLPDFCILLEPLVECNERIIGYLSTGLLTCFHIYLCNLAFLLLRHHHGYLHLYSVLQVVKHFYIYC